MKILLILLLTVSCAQNVTRGPASSGNYWLERNRSAMNEFDTAKFSENDTPTADEFTDPEKLSKIADPICGKAIEKECEKKVLKVFKKRLTLKYTHAKLQEVENFLEAYPEHWNRPKVIELLFIESHNKEIEAKRRAWIQQERKDADQMLRDATPTNINLHHHSN